MFLLAVDSVDSIVAELGKVKFLVATKKKIQKANLNRSYMNENFARN